MMVTGQTERTYSYDYANKLTGVTQGSWNVTKAFNYSAGRLGSVTLPNGVAVFYTYDSDSNIKSVTYKNGGTMLGTLTYNYDADGRGQSGVGGTLATIAIPATQSFTYYNDNSLEKVGTSAVNNDGNGSIKSGAVGTFMWDERGHVYQSSTLVGGQAVTQTNYYDALGRRYEVSQQTGSGDYTLGYVDDGSMWRWRITGRPPSVRFWG